MQDVIAGEDFVFPDRKNPIAGLDIIPPRLDGEPTSEADRIAILLCAGLRDAKGLHGETMLTAIGALVGRAAASAVAAHAAVDPAGDDLFLEVQTRTGTRFAFSDAVSRLLFDGVPGWTDDWTLLSALAAAAGRPVRAEAPKDWARHFAAGLGGDDEGEPLLLAGQNRSAIDARGAIRRFWPDVEAVMKEGSGDGFDRHARLVMLAAALVAMLAEVVPADAAVSHVIQAAMAGAKMPLPTADDEDLFSIVPPLPAPGEAADLSRIATPYFPFAPVWTDAPVETSAVASALLAMDGGETVRLRSVQTTPLPFWHDAMLSCGRLTSRRGRDGTLYVLTIGTDLFVLAFTGGDMSEIAARHPPLLADAAMAADWFRFRLGFIGPLSGRARLVETCEHLCLTGQPTEEMATLIDLFLLPLQPIRHELGWRVSACILFDGRLGRIDLHQRDSGELVMVPGTPPEAMLPVPALTDPFTSLMVGPFIPDIFPAEPIQCGDPVEPKTPPRGELQIPWIEASPAQRDAFLSFLIANGCELPDADLLVRHAALSFYPALAFCELTDLTAGKRGYVLIDPDGAGEDSWFMLDTTNSPIFAANERYLALDAENVCRYAAFFFSSVAGPHGAMPVIETLDELADVPERAAAALRTLAPVVPPVVIGQDEEGFAIGAALLFQEAVTKVTIRVATDGQVCVAGHELVLFLDGGLPGDDG